MSKLVAFLATIAALLYLSLWTPANASARKLDGIQKLDQVTDLSARRRHHYRRYYRGYYGPRAYYDYSGGGYPYGYGYGPGPYYGYYRPYYRPGFSFGFGF